MEKPFLVGYSRCGKCGRLTYLNVARGASQTWCRKCGVLLIHANHLTNDAPIKTPDGKYIKQMPEAMWKRAVSGSKHFISQKSFIKSLMKYWRGHR